ncbi:MAG: DUF2877 domain-containing protein [Candidatus Hodarchaeota archaeon]
MKNQHILCLEKVLNPLTVDSSYISLIKSKTTIQCKLKIIQEIKDPLEEFQKDFKKLRGKKTEEILKNLSHILGYGLGSTPESDDLFLGILAVNYCLNGDVCNEFALLASFPFEKFTTSESAQLIRKFLTQNFPPELVPFLRLLKGQLKDDQGKIRFELEVRKIRSLGTSSGYYFLLGVLWGLKYNIKRISL